VAWTATRIEPDQTIGTAMTHWDSAWNIEIAAHGYTALPRLVFLPTLPMTTRWVAGITGLTTIRAGLLVTFVFGLAGAILLHRLVERHLGTPVANRALLLLVFSPFAWVLSVIYTEAITLFAVAACFLALERRRWLLAGLAAALASGSRPNGVLIVVPCVVAAILAIHERREWRSLVAVILAPTTFLAWCAYTWYRTGSPTGYFDLQRDYWGQGTDFGRTTLQSILDVLRGDVATTNVTVTAFVVVLAWVLLVLAIRQRLPLTWLAYSGVLVLQVTVSRLPGSGGRYLLMAFPLFVAAARAVPERWFGEVVGLLASVASALFLVSILTIALTP
jgi:hypothetical protein